MTKACFVIAVTTRHTHRVHIYMKLDKTIAEIEELLSKYGEVTVKITVDNKHKRIKALAKMAADAQANPAMFERAETEDEIRAFEKTIIKKRITNVDRLVAAIKLGYNTTEKLIKYFRWTRNNLAYTVYKASNQGKIESIYVGQHVIYNVI